MHTFVCYMHNQRIHTYPHTYTNICTHNHTHIHTKICMFHTHIHTNIYMPTEQAHTRLYLRAICLSRTFSLTQTYTVHTHVFSSLQKWVSSTSSETLSKSSPSPYVCAYHIQIYTNAYTNMRIHILVSEETSVFNIFWDAFRKSSFPICMCVSYTNTYTCIHTCAFLYSCLGRNKHLPCLLRRFPKIALFHMYARIMYKYI